jgi:hypothetical protein
MEKNEILKTEVAMLSKMITDLSAQLEQIQSNLNKLIVVRDTLAEVIPPEEEQLELPLNVIPFEVVKD